MRGSFASSLALLLLSACHSSIGICGEVRVCGSDGTTYADRCAAGSAGVDVMYEGDCPEDCTPARCAEGFAPTTDGCDCVPTDAGADMDAGADVGEPDTYLPDTDAPDAEADTNILDAHPDTSCDLTRTDPFPCGDCSLSCDTEEGVEGLCVVQEDAVVCSCEMGETSCDMDVAGRLGCVDLDRNERHCGRCGDACAEGQLCVDGFCKSPPTRCTNVRDTVTFVADGVCRATCLGVTWDIETEGGRTQCTRTAAMGSMPMTSICAPGLEPLNELDCARALLGCCAEG